MCLTHRICQITKIIALKFSLHIHTDTSEHSYHPRTISKFSFKYNTFLKYFVVLKNMTLIHLKNKPQTANEVLYRKCLLKRKERNQKKNYCKSYRFESAHRTIFIGYWPPILLHFLSLKMLFNQGIKRRRRETIIIWEFVSYISSTWWCVRSTYRKYNVLRATAKGKAFNILKATLPLIHLSAINQMETRLIVISS